MSMNELQIGAGRIRGRLDEATEEPAESGDIIGRLGLVDKTIDGLASRVELLAKKLDRVMKPDLAKASSGSQTPKAMVSHVADRLEGINETLRQVNYRLDEIIDRADI